MATLYPIFDYEEDIPGYGMGSPLWQAYTPDAPAAPSGGRSLPLWQKVGLGLLAGIWAQHNQQGFDAAMGHLRQGLLERERMRLQAQQRQDEQNWRQAQMERWAQDRNDNFTRWREEQAYRQGRDRIEDAWKEEDLKRKQKEFEANQANVTADNARQAQAEARRAAEWNAENYGYPWGAAEQAQRPAAAALNLILQGAMPAAGGLLPAVQPEQIDVGRPAQSYLNKVATERALQAMADYRDLNNRYLQQTFDDRVAGIALNNEAKRLANEIAAIELETRPQLRAAQIEALRQRALMYPLQRKALQALIDRRLIDTKWVGLLNLDKIAGDAGLTVDPSSLQGFSGLGLPPVAPAGLEGVGAPRPGPNAESPTQRGVGLIPKPAGGPSRNLDDTLTERDALAAAQSGVSVPTWRVFRSLGLAPGPQVADSFRYWKEKGVITGTGTDDDPYTINIDSPLRQRFLEDQDAYRSGKFKYVNGKKIRTDGGAGLKGQAPKPAARPTAKPTTTTAAKPVPAKVEKQARQALAMGRTWDQISRALATDGYNHAQRAALRKKLGL